MRLFLEQSLLFLQPLAKEVNGRAFPWSNPGTHRKARSFLKGPRPLAWLCSNLGVSTLFIRQRPGQAH